MAYGILKADTLTYSTPTGDVSLSISGLSFQGATLISGVSGIFTTSVSGATVTGNVVLGTTISGITGIFTTTLSGATITGNTLQGSNITGVSGTFTTRVSGATVTGDTVQGGNISGVSGVFTTTLSGATVTGDVGNFTTINAITTITETGITKTNLTVTGNVNSSGNLTVAGSGTIVNGLNVGGTVTGATGQFNLTSGVSGVFTTQLSGATVIASNITGTSGTFTNRISGATITGVTGNFTTLNATSIPGYAVLSGAQTFSGGQRGLVSVVNYATGIALDLATNNNFQITLTGNTTLQNPSNVVSGQAGTVTIIQGSSGNTMAFGSSWQYPGGSGSTPSLTATSGATDVLAYYVINSTKIAYRLVQDIKA